MEVLVGLLLANTELDDQTQDEVWQYLEMIEAVPTYAGLKYLRSNHPKTLDGQTVGDLVNGWMEDRVQKSVKSRRMRTSREGAARPSDRPPYVGEADLIEPATSDPECNVRPRMPFLVVDGVPREHHTGP